MATNNNPPKLTGGKTSGSGRPLGAKNKNNKESREKLAELDFDPIRESVELYRTTALQLKLLEDAGKNNETTTKLRNLLSRINSDLLSYGYSKLPSMSQIENLEKTPMAIRLTMRKDD